ncbi:S1C family serine protease [Microbacterium caowuchunii]|uniref:PDZ domain-containing protein n=1 Tax=Microbacterium caowuchunii TaxID=2614638 RepID=A0A5N0TI82_9MICO|nr:trypsin-like peptidase domain-containing protein [Microbacterium caowuchunii]KAA9134810.1 PDZ domain-containing protein [Microbacterium caowuchunii]
MSDIEGTTPEPTAADSSAAGPAASADRDLSRPVGDVPPAAQPPQTGSAAPSQASYDTPARPPLPTGAPSAAIPPRPPYPAGYPTYGAPSAPAGAAFGPGAQTSPTTPLADTPAPSAPRKKSGAARTVGLLVAAAIVGGAAGLGGTYAGISLWGTSTEASAGGSSVITVNDTENVNRTTAVAAKVVPSVVTISASSSSGAGTGSGVIISDDGYVLTNTHVVTLDGATADPTITVTTSENRVYKASIVGTDPTYDLAVIKLEDASGLPAIEFADSSKLNVGDQAVAVGAPLGLDNTVTTGIVSALNRSIEIASSAAPDDSSGEEQEEPGAPSEGPFQFDFGQGQATPQSSATIKIAVIQTDAAINPGNSGGALVDDEGRLIGINVAIASSGGTSSGQSGNIGVGFAIPSNIAERVAEEIIETGEATHGLLGATVQNAASLENAKIEGAAIAEVTPDGAAAEGGLRAGDIITEFNGVPIDNSVDLTAQVRAAAAGSEASVRYVRDGESRTTDVTLGTLQP